MSAAFKSTGRFSRVGLIVGLLLVVALIASGAILAAPGAREEIPEQLQAALEAPLREKVKELSQLEDENGQKTTRGSYFQRFVKVDNDTYEVVFHIRKAVGDEMLTERWHYILKRQGSDSWVIGAEELQRTVDNLLFREMPEDETFHKYASFNLDVEGLEISSGPGSLWMDYWRGKPNTLIFTSDSLKYDYTPPAENINHFEMANYHAVSAIVKKLNPDDVVFKPEKIFINCTAAECEKLLESFTGVTDSTLDQMPSILKGDYNEFMSDQKGDRKDNPMSGFQTNPRPDFKWWSIGVKRAGAREHWARLTYNNHAPEEMSFSVPKISRFQPIFTYYAKETRDSGLSPYDLEVRPDLNALDYDLKKITGKVELAILDADTMTCDLTYKIAILRPVDILRFGIAQVRDLNQNENAKNPSLRIEQIEDGNGEELTFIRRGAANGIIVLPERMEPGQELTVHVKFENQNSLYKLNPSYSYVSRGGWLPFVRFGDMIDEFELEITVPKRYEILGIGHRVSDSTSGQTKTATYKSDSAVTFPTVIFGDYLNAKSRIKAEKLDGSEIPVNVYLDKTSTMSRSKIQTRDDVRDVIAEANAGIDEIRPSSMKPVAEQAANSLNLYREVYGVDYPFGKLDLVNDPIGPGFYGQAPASIVYLGQGVFTATGSVAHFGGTNISKFQESVVAHEVGHQWWGSLITMGNSRNYWFVESLAEYSSALFVESLYGAKNPEKGRKAYLEKVEEWRRTVMTFPPVASVQDVDTMWGGEGGARTAAIYNQGPYAFHIMRETFGDEKFFAFLKNLAGELQGKAIVTRDIERVAEESFGGTMKWFFDQWIRGVGLPEYTVTWSSRQAEDGNYIVEGNIAQRIVVGKDKVEIEGRTYRGIASVTVTGKDNKDYPVRFLVEDQETPFRFKVPVEPMLIELNKNGEILAHDALIERI